MSKNIIGRCIVNAPITDPIATKNTSFLNENPTLRWRDLLFFE